MTDTGDRVTYRPLPTRSPGLLEQANREAVVTRLADDGSGRAMLLFANLDLIAAVPDEMETDQ